MTDSIVDTSSTTSPSVILTSSTSSSSSTTKDNNSDNEKIKELMQKAVIAHKQNQLSVAEECYRSVLAYGNHPGAAILLANLLLSTNTSDTNYPLRRTDALVYANIAMQDIKNRSINEQVKLYARYAYFLLQYTGYVQFSGAQPTLTIDHEQKKQLLNQAITSLEQVTILQPSYILAWRNLTLAYTSAERLQEAEHAAAQAVHQSLLQSKGYQEYLKNHPTETNVPSVETIISPIHCDWELHYKHGKALKRIQKSVEAVEKYCDACEASNGKMDIVLYWLRIANASPPENIPVKTRQRVQTLLQKYSSSSSTTTNASSLYVPHDYIRKLFDGYSTKFDEHLTQHLGYKTPRVLLNMGLETVQTLTQRSLVSSNPASTKLWKACADLGCGTGLAGVEFRSYVDYLTGCDLSGGMVNEARNRNLYNHLDVEEIEAWLSKQPKQYYDVVLAADVLVYIGPLEGIFRKTAEVMVPSSSSNGSTLTVPTNSPSLFIFSTEALGSEEEVCTPGYNLSGTGRCVHSRQYILHLAKTNGFVLQAVKRQPIRQNAGKDVIGDVFVLEYKGLENTM